MKKRSKPMVVIAPPDYRPARPNELIGPAAGIAAALLETERGQTIKQLLFGPWGAGKTSIVNMLAGSLAIGVDIEKVNGRMITIPMVESWLRSSCYGSLFGGWKVKQIEEADLIPPGAQELMLTYLDDLPARTAVIASSNQNLATLAERFQTRFEFVQVPAPADAELASWLTKRWQVPAAAAEFIALGACGNVRQALLDAAGFFTFGSVPARPKAASIPASASRSAGAARGRRFRALRNGRVAGPAVGR